MDQKDRYKKFCSEEKSIPVFLTYDWLEAIAPNNWGVALEQKNNKIVGVFPYIVKHNKGLKIIELPPFTPTGGVWLKYEKELKPSTKIAYEKEIISNLIDKLPSFDSFHQRFHPSIINWMPFYSKGFVQSTWYKYILNDISNSDLVFEGFDSEVRRSIRKSEKTISIEVDNSIDHLFELNLKSYGTKKVDMPLDKKMFERIFRLCTEKNIGEVLIAKEGDKIHSAGLFIFDKNVCHFLITASDPEFKNSGAMSLLIWSAIKKYSGQCKSFNFEGSMIPGIEEFLRSFGGEQIPYFVISKTNSKILKIKKFLTQL